MVVVSDAYIVLFSVAWLPRSFSFAMLGGPEWVARRDAHVCLLSLVAAPHLCMPLSWCLPSFSRRPCVGDSQPWLRDQDAGHMPTLCFCPFGACARDSQLRRQH
jgi:hypothetical protein